MSKRAKMYIAGILTAGCMMMGNLFPAAASTVPQVNGEHGYYNYIVPGDDGYFLLCGNLIGYWDGMKEHQALPLCSRPDCSHNTTDCTAYVQILNPKLFYVKDSLYVFGQAQYDDVTKSEGFPLWKIAADGSAKEAAFYIDELPNQYTVFKDRVYYEVLKEDENGKVSGSVWSQTLDGKDKKEIWKSSLQQGEIVLMQGIGEELYIQEIGIDMSIDLNDTALDMDEVQEERNLLTYDPGTDSWKTNPLDNEKEGMLAIIRNIYEGNMYYSFLKENGQRLWSMPVDGKGSPSLIGDLPEYPWTADAEYAYTYCRRDMEKQSSGLKIYSHKGEVMQEINFPDINVTLDLLPVTKEYVFGYMTTYIEEESVTEYAIVLLEREKIAEGNAEVLPVFQTR